jgi:hypothetical protein
MTRATKARVLLETAAVVIVLVPLHFFLQRPGPTAWGTAVALLVFFVPAGLAAARIRPGPRAVASEAFAGLVFGFGLGLLAGGLGGLGRAILHAVTGDPLPVRLALWVAIAAAWMLAAGVAYALILFLVWGLRLAVGPAGAPGWGGEGGEAPADARFGIEPRILSGPGHQAGAGSSRGRPPPLAAVLTGIAGISVLMAGLVVLVEGHAPGAVLMVLGAAALAVAAGLWLAAPRRAR